MYQRRFRIGLYTFAAAMTFAGSAHALDDRFYLAPMASYVLADDDRHSKDGMGGTLAFGTRLSAGTEIELLGDYLRFKGKGSTDNMSLGGGGIGINFFGWEGSGPYLHADIQSNGDPVLNVGLGLYLLGDSGFGLRAEALYHNDDVDKFREPQFNLGLRIPIGHVAPPPVVAPAEPAPVQVVPAPPPPVCADGIDNDGDGKVDYPADPGCTSADDMDETDPAPPPPSCPPPMPGQPVTLEGCKAGDVIVLRGVNFDFDKATLTVNAKTILDEVSTALLARPDIKFEIGGHTDSKGSDEYNLKLSDRRAASVAAYLARKGITKDRETSKGYGESMPVADNDTDAGRELNRRVELKITESNGGVTVAPAAPAAATPTMSVAPPAAVPVAAGGAVAVSIANFSFSPETITVPVGTTVTWTNSDGTAHSVKFVDTGDSGKFASGGTFKRTFDQPGEYPYQCGVHSTMKGKVVVQ